MTAERIIRKCRLEDIDAVAELERLSFPDPQSKDFLCSVLERNAVFYVSESEIGITGYIVCMAMPPEAELYSIAVLPDAKGTGIADALFDTALCELKKLGTETLFLEVRQSNTRAIHFYKRKGFCELGTRKGYYKTPTEDAVLMSLDATRKLN